MTGFKPGDFGVTIYYGHRPVKKRCKDCPFTAAEEGRDYLEPGRLDGIKFAATMGQLFPCHKTVYQKGVEFEEDEETGEHRARPGSTGNIKPAPGRRNTPRGWRRN